MLFPSEPNTTPIAVGWPQLDDGRLIWTARYSNRRIAESGLVPVRTSRGYPRFRLRYQLIEALPDLMPDRSMHRHEDPAEFDRRYLGKLERIGIDTILAQVQEISLRYHGRGVVLLCFEDVRQQACHQTPLATWLNAHGGHVLEQDEEPITRT